MLRVSCRCAHASCPSDYPTKPDDQALSGGGQVGALDAPSFVATIAEWVVAGYYRAFEAVESELEDLDARVMSSIPRDVTGDLARLVEIRRWIGTLRRALSPHREVVVALSHPELDALSTKDSAARFAALVAWNVHARNGSGAFGLSWGGSVPMMTPSSRCRRGAACRCCARGCDRAGGTIRLCSRRCSQRCRWSARSRNGVRRRRCPPALRELHVIWVKTLGRGRTYGCCHRTERRRPRCPPM